MIDKIINMIYNGKNHYCDFILPHTKRILKRGTPFGIEKDSGQWWGSRGLLFFSSFRTF